MTRSTAVSQRTRETQDGGRPDHLGFRDSEGSDAGDPGCAVTPAQAPAHCAQGHSRSGDHEGWGGQESPAGAALTGHLDASSHSSSSGKIKEAGTQLQGISPRRRTSAPPTLSEGNPTAPLSLDPHPRFQRLGRLPTWNHVSLHKQSPEKVLGGNGPQGCIQCSSIYSTSLKLKTGRNGERVSGAGTQGWWGRVGVATKGQPEPAFQEGNVLCHDGTRVNVLLVA